MNESVSLKHPLFDPTSLYSRMRASIRVEDKMRGYFHWLAARAKRVCGTPPPSEPRSGAELRREPLVVSLCVPERLPSWQRYCYVCGPEVGVLDRQEVSSWVLRAGKREKRADGEFRGISADVELFITRERTGRPGLGMLVTDSTDDWLCWFLSMDRENREVRFDREDREVRCRAFLLEPEVVKRLAEALRMQGAPEHSILDRAFEREVVATNLETARILAAVPELEGEIKDITLYSRPLPIPDGYDTFPPRAEPLQVVIVIDSERKMGTPTNEPT
jgi:hypothetical protein